MLPTPPPPPVDLVRQVNALADHFDAAWKAGLPPPIESLLEQISPDARPELLRQLLRIEGEHRQQQGRPLTAAEAQKRFSSLGSWVSSVLSGLGLDAAEPLTLTITSGEQAGRTFQLAGHSTCLVGRGPTGVQLAVVSDPGMSRVHFLIEYNPPVARLADMRSRNKTRVNGAVVEQTDLGDGDEIRAGQTTFRVRLPRVDHTQILSGESSPPTTTLAHAPSPESFPGYVILNEVGKGGMGVVYRARRVSDGRLVALKRIHPAVAPKADVLARFQREVAILRKLTHPNVVAFLDAGEAGGVLYLAMEFVEGDCADLLVKRHGPFAPERVVALGCQLLDALDHAHRQDVVHRDVKPGNVMLTTADGRETLKLADFGLARAYQASAMSGLTMTGTPGGTPGYMPPEQVMDFRNARPASDQYAAAATLYFLLTGHAIYEPSSSTMDLLKRILDDEPIPLRLQCPPLPPKLGEVIRRALARDARQRFADVAAMREALAKCG
jgi:serine/threonine-protein kinase